MIRWPDAKDKADAAKGIVTDSGDALTSGHDRHYVCDFVDDAVAVIGTLRGCLIASGVAVATVDAIIETAAGDA